MHDYGTYKSMSAVFEQVYRMFLYANVLLDLWFSISQKKKKKESRKEGQEPAHSLSRIRYRMSYHIRSGNETLHNREVPCTSVCRLLLSME